MKKKIILNLCVGLVLMLMTANAFSANSDEKLKERSRNQQMGTVPNVVGMVYKDAIPCIQQAGFVAKAKGPGSLSVKIKRTVTTQTPASGQLAVKGSAVVVDLR